MGWQTEASGFEVTGKCHVQLDLIWDSSSMSNHFRTRAAFFILDFRWPRPLRPSSLEDREILSRSFFGSSQERGGKLANTVMIRGLSKARLQPDKNKITLIMPSPSMNVPEDQWLQLVSGTIWSTGDYFDWIAVMVYSYTDPYGETTLVVWQWAATSINNAIEKSHAEIRNPQRDRLFSFRIRWRDSCPATPISCTNPARKSTDPDTESISRWIARSRVVSPVEALIVAEDNKGRCALRKTLDPCGYLIWDHM